MKIISLTASNVKRLRAVEIRPEGSLVVIGGKNGAGKTSVLDSVSATLGGAKLCPKVPIRRGQTTAEARVVLDDLVVIRRWTQSSSTLCVETRDGARYKSPQKILDDLGAQFMDPLEFLRLDAKKQLQMLQELVGLDLTELEGKRAYAFESRRDTNRQLKAEQSRLDGMANYDDTPDDPVSVADLMQELERRRVVNETNERARRQVEFDTKRLTTELAGAQSREEALVAEVTQLRADLEAAEADLREAEQARADAHATLDRMKSESKGYLAAIVDEETDELSEQIRGAEDVNRKVRENALRQVQAENVQQLKEQSEEWTAKIEAFDAERLATIEAAEFPVEGLGVGDDGVTFNGLPLQQASGAEQLRVSVAMALAMNRKLPVLLIRDGSLLDEDNLALVAEMAEEADAQVWIERVGEERRWSSRMARWLRRSTP